MEHTPPMITPELLDVRQTAEFLNIGRNRVYEMADSGQLPHLRVGNRLRFSRRSLLNWIDEKLEEMK